MKNIILGVDFNHDFEKTLTQALKYANTCDAEITPVHAVVNPPALYRITKENILRKKFNEVLKATEKKLDIKGLIVKQLVFVEGQVSDVLNSAANKLQADMIMTGSGRDERKSLGVITRRLIRSAHVPVWTVDYHEHALTNVLCPIDYSDHSEISVRVAMNIARTFSIPLYILHVTNEHIHHYSSFIEGAIAETPDFEDAINATPHTSEENLQLEMDSFLKKFDMDGIEVHGVFKEGRSAGSIVDFCKEIDSDLLVMGTKGHSALAAGLLGSTVERVIDELPCSLLSVGNP